MKTPFKACILGGTGFVGRELSRHLVARGYACQLPTRRIHRHRDLQLHPGVTLLPISAFDPQSLAALFTGCDLVVNLIGILNESPRTRFEPLHVDLVRDILSAASTAGVPRLLHLSALGAIPPGDESGTGSAYLRSKGAGEALVLATSTPATTVFRPSVIFGRRDSLFNRFANLIDWAPGILPLPCPQARFAPVWVGDVAEAMARSLDHPESIGRAYDLCGPRVFSLHELVAYTATLKQRRVRIIDLGDRASQRLAHLCEYLPGKPFSMDNYLSMQVPSVCAGSNGLTDLGIAPTDPDVEMPLALAPG